MATMTSVTRSGQTDHLPDLEKTSKQIVAREGSELADLLRASGWVARFGWRSLADDGDPVWHVRFELPDMQGY